MPVHCARIHGPFAHVEVEFVDLRDQRKDILVGKSKQINMGLGEYGNVGESPTLCCVSKFRPISDQESLRMRSPLVREMGVTQSCFASDWDVPRAGRSHA